MSMIANRLGFFQILGAGDPNSIRLFIPAVNVDSDQTRIVLPIPIDDARIQSSTGFISALIANAENVRAYDASKSTEWDRHVDVNVTVDDGFIYVAFENMSSTVDNEFVLYADTTMLADYAVTDPHGRNNTFSGNFIGFWDLQQDPTGTAPQFTDLTGNSAGLTAQGTWSAGDVKTGILGQAIETGLTTPHYVVGAFNNSSAWRNFPYNFGGWIRAGDGLPWTGTDNNVSHMGLVQWGAASAYFTMRVGADTRAGQDHMRVGSDVRATTNESLYSIYDSPAVVNEWAYVAMDLLGKQDKNVYVNGVFQHQHTVQATESADFNDILLGRLRSTDNIFFSDGQQFNQVWVRTGAMNVDLYRIEHESQRNFGTFVTSIVEEPF